MGGVEWSRRVICPQAPGLHIIWAPQMVPVHLVACVLHLEVGPRVEGKQRRPGR
jgi:hypothetical protein